MEKQEKTQKKTQEKTQKTTQGKTQKNASKKYNSKEVLSDYRLASLSRNLSSIGRREVLSGKAKFGIFGDGKEIAQLALAKQFKDGDWRSGYYRDQTWMMAMDLYSAEEFFHQLYGNTDPELNPGNGGRVFNNHFSTPNINEDGSWKELTKLKNSSADISPTAGQMPRLLGLAYASKMFRENKELAKYKKLSIKGNEVAFGSIGDASTSEGHFWETVNAAGVLQVPMALSVWDDGYGISVPKKYQTTKGSISEVLKGFESKKKGEGIRIFTAKGWDYPGLIETYKKGIDICRREHVPVLFHIEEMTQPLGHSTSGSHERYKDEERLQWEKDYDPIKKMREWILAEGIAAEEELEKIEKEAETEAKAARKTGWNAFQEPIKIERDALVKLVREKDCSCENKGKEDSVENIIAELEKVMHPIRKDNFVAARRIMRNVCGDCKKKDSLKDDLQAWLKRNRQESYQRYNTHLYNETDTSALKVKAVEPEYSDDSQEVPGREVLKANYEVLFAKNPRLLTFGEDAGKIGGVNQSYEGLQSKFGELRVTDTGIREATILGQGLGLALRGLRPIAEIQYLDYLLYALQGLSDDVATTHYRTAGNMVAPLIISTRGHRLEGIWHSGSPLAMLINAVRGVHVCVPRDMTRASGFYNTLLAAEDPGIVVEPLNGYRQKERKPDNPGEYKIPLGVPEILIGGEDITVVSYGSTLKVAMEAVEHLRDHDISVELIDVQTLLPFDINGIIKESLKKTGRILFLDEDVPGGTTAYMMQQVLEKQNGWFYLDSKPATLSAREHRPAYTTDGDYLSKPSAEDIFDVVYSMMREAYPDKYPDFLA
ncbi:MAG: thiamine pyrophosphate-dependent enzyme [Bacteroidales bacterium]|nr:thiamine pyrophosphate-dependent enzyme [Bacteroidales bacterium]